MLGNILAKKQVAEGMQEEEELTDSQCWLYHLSVKSSVAKHKPPFGVSGDGRRGLWYLPSQERREGRLLNVGASEGLKSGQNGGQNLQLCL